MIRVIVNGGGRMAESFCKMAAAGALEVIGVVSPHQHPEWLKGLAHATRLDDVAAPADLVVDFSLPEGTLMAAEWCGRSGVPLLSGVTGLDDSARAALDRAARDVAVLWAPNLSLGVNLLESLCRTLAAALGGEAAVEIHEVHHQWKKDAPSGTALHLGRAIQAERPAGAAPVQYRSDREGEVIGTHRVRFERAGEVMELSHEALDRAVFARGAVDAARWLCRQAPGRYRVSDWLAGRNV